MTIRDFVAKLSDEERREIISSHAKFERDGVVGEEPIRTYTRQYLQDSKAPISIWMDRLAAECWRFYAMEWMKD